jgi:hypothetical protein
MIRQVLDLLRENDFMVEDDDIQFAKGAYELPQSFREIKEKHKRRKLIK